MIKLQSLTQAERDVFYNLAGLNKHNTLLPESVINHLNKMNNMFSDSFKELMAIILVGKGHFSNFNDSLNAVDSFQKFLSTAGLNGIYLSAFLENPLAKTWSQSGLSNVVLTRCSATQPERPRLSSLCLDIDAAERKLGPIHYL